VIGGAARFVYSRFLFCAPRYKIIGGTARLPHAFCFVHQGTRSNFTFDQVQDHRWDSHEEPAGIRTGEHEDCVRFLKEVKRKQKNNKD
jgi:hypothetical protein